MLLSLHFIRSNISQLPLLYIVLFIYLFQIYLAIYFVFADLVLFGQYLYYNMCWKRKHKGNTLHFFVLYSLLDLSCSSYLVDTYRKLHYRFPNILHLHFLVRAIGQMECSCP